MVEPSKEVHWVIEAREVVRFWRVKSRKADGGMGGGVIRVEEVFVSVELEGERGWGGWSAY